MKRFFKIDNVLNVIGILFAIGFIIGFINDYYLYQNTGTYQSAPFYVYLIDNIVLILLPSIVCFILALYIKKRNKTK